MENKPRVFIDTNIVIDFICRRRLFFEDALAIFELSADEKIDLLVSDLSIANIRYITRKDIGLQEFYKVMRELNDFYTIVTVGASAVRQAIAIEAKDFEDALQYFSAVNAGADIIVTRNIKDYAFAKTTVMSPQEFIRMIRT